jgi:hypothetical protein
MHKGTGGGASVGQVEALVCSSEFDLPANGLKELVWAFGEAVPDLEPDTIKALG